jgi:hypothetical protein
VIFGDLDGFLADLNSGTVQPQRVIEMRDAVVAFLVAWDAEPPADAAPQVLLAIAGLRASLREEPPGERP